MEYKINQREQGALKGLPHLARLVYLEAIRPYMDYATGIVGIKRGISYQSLREELYVEPHKGYASGSPSKDQMRRAVKTLERAGLISIESEGMKLILKCKLATWDFSDQNKVATKPPYEATTQLPLKNNNKTSDCDLKNEKATITKTTKAATPPVSDINYVFVCDAFQQFWQMYPVKFSKQKAWEVFQALSVTEGLFNEIIAGLESQCVYRKEALMHGTWMPQWKQAANWLMQRCWEDELPSLKILSEEKADASSKGNNTKQERSVDLLWESCKDAFDEVDNSSDRKIIYLNASQRAY